MNYLHVTERLIKYMKNFVIYLLLLQSAWHQKGLYVAPNDSVEMAAVEE